MQITLSDIGKKYNREWIFRHIDRTIASETALVILGSNGSGKSTLLQLLSGLVHASAGTIEYTLNGNTVEHKAVFRHVSIASPYLELHEDFNLEEILTMHQRFKPLRENQSIKALADRLNLSKAAQKPMKYYSSGMKQRVRLGLAVLTDSPLLLLDEPTSNLDREGIAWYQELVAANRSNRTIVVCSNHQEAEYKFCSEELLVEDFKKK